MKKNILVTGATGFIGKNVICFLNKQSNIQTWGISKNGGSIDKTFIHQVDLTNKLSVSEWKKDKPIFDAIFHLAATIPNSYNESQYQSCFLTNITIDNNVLSLVESPETTFVYISSTSVYGKSEKTPIHEDSRILPDNYYSLGKYMGELMCQMEAQKKGFVATSLRISAPYGPNQKMRTVINIFIDAAISSYDLLYYGSGNRSQTFTYIDDVVQSIWLAYTNRTSGIFNIASNRNINMKELAQLIIDQTPSSTSKAKPAGIIDIQDSYRGIFMIDNAEKKLKFTPKISLEEGIQACIRSKYIQNIKKLPF